MNLYYNRRRSARHGQHFSADQIKQGEHLRALSPQSWHRFKELTQNACIPLSLGHPTRVSVLPYGENAREYASLPLPDHIQAAAREISRRENQKLIAKGVREGWIDDEKLAVRSIRVQDSFYKDNNVVSIRASTMRWSEILAMKDFPFEKIAELSAFKLDTNTHLIARDGAHYVLLVAARGKKPGDVRMGDESLLAPSAGEKQLTLAVNGTIDRKTMGDGPHNESTGEAVRYMSIWAELEEEHGLVSYAQSRNTTAGSYGHLGLMLDAIKFVGAVGIVNEVITEFSPAEIEIARQTAKDKSEIGPLEIVPMEMASVARYLVLNRDNMLPQLITGLVLLGYKHWGDVFLRLSEK